MMRPELSWKQWEWKEAWVVSYFSEGVGGQRLLLEIGNKILEVTPRFQTCLTWVGGVGGSRSCIRVSNCTRPHTSTGQGVVLMSFLSHSFWKPLNPVLTKIPISFCPVLSSLHLPLSETSCSVSACVLGQPNSLLSITWGVSKKGNDPIPIVSRFSRLDLNLVKKPTWFWNHSLLLSFLSLNPEALPTLVPQNQGRDRPSFTSEMGSLGWWWVEEGTLACNCMGDPEVEGMVGMWALALLQSLGGRCRRMWGESCGARRVKDPILLESWEPRWKLNFPTEVYSTSLEVDNMKPS